MNEPIIWREQPTGQVCLCGIGARTPLGFSAAASAAAVRGSISAIGAHPIFMEKAGEPVAMARDAALDPRLPIAQRMEQLLVSAITEAIAAAVPPDANESLRSARLACLIGIPEPRPGLPSDVAAVLGTAVSDAFAWPLASHQVLQRGHAAGLMALQLAAQRIEAGELDICIAAGVDSYHDARSLAWLDRNGALMSAGNRNGFPPGEGAGACLIAARSFAETHGLPVRARIMAAATAREPHPIGTTGVCTGEGLTAALNGASAAMLPPDQAITATYCDLNGQRYRNEEYVYALLRVQELFVDAHDYECPADCWGDMGAATGPLLASLAVCASERGYSKGPFPLAWSGSISGYRTAVLFALAAG
jgi:3-oxoacyl-[acyl-carrier-protein] synthase-1